MAALLAFSAIKNNDRVGLILFTDRVEKFVPPKKGKGHVLHVITEILEAKPEHAGTNLQEALTLLGNVSRRRAVAALSSSNFAISGLRRPVSRKRFDDLADATLCAG